MKFKEFQYLLQFFMNRFIFFQIFLSSLVNFGLFFSNSESVQSH